MKRILISLVAAGVMFTGAVPAEAAVTQPGLSTKRTEMLAQLNAARKTKCGSNSLALKTVNNTAASRHSVDMAANSFLSHYSSDGTSAQDRMTLYGMTGLKGENIMRGGGANTAAKAHAYFMSSAGHKANLLDCRYKKVGVGYAFQDADSWGDYWTVSFSST